MHCILYKPISSNEDHSAISAVCRKQTSCCCLLWTRPSRDGLGNFMGDWTDQVLCRAVRRSQTGPSSGLMEYSMVKLTSQSRLLLPMKFLMLAVDSSPACGTRLMLQVLALEDWRLPDCQMYCCQWCSHVMSNVMHVPCISILAFIIRLLSVSLSPPGSIGLPASGHTQHRTNIACPILEGAWSRRDFCKNSALKDRSLSDDGHS